MLGKLSKNTFTSEQLKPVATERDLRSGTSQVLVRLFYIRSRAIPGWLFIKISFLAVVTAGAGVEYNSKMHNRCKVLFLTLG